MMKLSLSIKNMLSNSSDIDVGERATFSLVLDLQQVLHKYFSNDITAEAHAARYSGDSFAIHITIYRINPTPEFSMPVNATNYTELVINPENVDRINNTAKEYTIELGGKTTKMRNKLRLRKTTAYSSKDLLKKIDYFFRKNADLIINEPY